MPLKFIINQGSAGSFRFSLVSRNGQVLVTSDDYGSRAAVLAGVRSIKSHAAHASIDDQSRVRPAANQPRQSKRRGSKRPASGTTKPAQAPEEETSQSEPPTADPAPAFVEPEAPEPGPKLVSMRVQAREVPAGNMRRVVSMPKPVRRIVSLRDGPDPEAS